MKRQPCLMCHGPEQLRAGDIDLSLGAPVCDEHGAQLDAMARREQELHPDGRCTDTCGCMTFEELDAKLAAAELGPIE